MIPTNTLSAPASRYDLIDALRGTALIGMVVYHLAWDLALTGFVRASLPLDGHWTLLARATAASFLALVGVSLVLAGDRGVTPRRFLRRLGLIAGAAGLVTLVTWFAFPTQFVFFGILHHIVVASVLALPFRRAPTVLILLAAAVSAALPLVVSDARFDHPALVWLGLGQQNFATVDFVPLFPWFGAVLAGMAVARYVNTSDAAWTRWRAGTRVARALVWSGRRSLWIYLAHQPLLLAVLFSLSALFSPQQTVPPAGARFLSDCQAGCAATGTTPGVCRAACECTADGARAEGLWEQVIAGRMDPAVTARLHEIANSCTPRP